VERLAGTLAIPHLPLMAHTTLISGNSGAIARCDLAPRSDVEGTAKHLPTELDALRPVPEALAG
jgi:hypothetical protein